MNITFHMHDPEDGRSCLISQEGVESIDDVLQRFLDFLKGASYDYVKFVGAEFDDGRMKWSTL